MGSCRVVMTRDAVVSLIAILFCPALDMSLGGPIFGRETAAW